MLKVNMQQFAQAAMQEDNRWNILAGHKVRYKPWGQGVITWVDHKPGQNITIRIRFNLDEHCGVFFFNQSHWGELTEIEFPEYPTLNVPATTPGPAPSQLHEDIQAAQFQLNEEVSLVNNPRQRGRVVHSFQDARGLWNHEIYISAENRPIYKESDLKLYSPEIKWGDLNDFLRDLASAKMRKPMSDALYALYASRTKFEVYQFKPALKFLANPDQRLLIADEVGLGKTIEAGIIYLELQARIGLERVLIVCPSSLKQKWQDEMKSRFDEDFMILNMDGIRRFLHENDMVGNTAPLRAIVSLELIRREEIAERFADIKLDLLVIDEAHHCRNSGTLTNAIATTLTENSDAALLLTATPLQMGHSDLFNLLKILSPGEFDNFTIFEDRLEPNKYVNMAAEYLERGKSQPALIALRKVEQTAEKKRFLGNPYYQAVVRILEAPSPTKQELVLAQRRLLELNTLASVFTRTRKRDVQEKAPKRTAFTLTVNFTPEEEEIYNRVVEEVRENFAAQHWSGAGSGWITVMKERQAASCISAMVKKMEEKEEALDQEEVSFMSGFSNPDDLDDSSGDIDAWDDSAPRRRHIRSTVSRPTLITDSKFETFWGALKKVLEDDPKSKVLVFSFFVGTIEHISRELARLGVSVLTIHGGYKVTDRQAIIENFRDNPKFRVLVSSDVGSEGLDFQFCDTLFNYDLPWNPMKVEQRIGRIDRFGQESDRIRIYNMVIDNSIESRIINRLYERIEIFKHSIGDIEVILGDQIRELTQAVFSNRLSDAEQVQRAEQAAKTIMRQKQDMEDFEEQRLQFLGQEAILSTAVNNTIESGRFISDVEVHALVNGYIKEKFRLSHLDSNGPDDATFTLFANNDLTDELKTFIYGPKKNDRTAHQFLPKLIPGKEIPITFSHELAFKRKLLEFITPRHPLAQAAREYWEEKDQECKRVYKIGLQTDIAPVGKYYFFIFSLDTEGSENNSRIIPVVISSRGDDIHQRLSDQFLRLVQTSGLLKKTTFRYNETDLSIVETDAFRHMTTVRDQLSAEMAESNDAIVNARLTGVEQSYQAKTRHIKEILGKITNASIQRMYESQLRNLKAKKNAKEKEIEKGRQLQVNFTLLMSGFLEVEKS